MALSAVNQIEGVNGGAYQRLYIPTGLAGDSQYPFRPGQPVRLELVETDCERHALVVVPDKLKIDRDATALGVQIVQQAQASLEEAVDP